MTKKVKILVSQSDNPWFNLATEDWIFQELGDNDHVLFLWRNCDTVVIGRSQNPWQECHLDKMKSDSIYLARRQSGGGAVFHDLGNTNFTFLSKKSVYDRQQNFQIITKALARFHVDAQVSGRNDIVVVDDEGMVRKVSGSAFKEKIDRAFHHGTLLLDTDLNKLQNYLNPNQKKLQAKGVKSVRSRVINLAKLNPKIAHDTLCEAIVDNFRSHHAVDAEVEWLDPSRLANDKLLQYYQQMQDWEWLYGQTLEFTHEFAERFDWGLVDVQLQVKNAIIEDARVYSDSLHPEWIARLAGVLCGTVYSSVAVFKVLRTLEKEFPHCAAEIEAISLWLSNEIK